MSPHPVVSALTVPAALLVLIGGLGIGGIHAGATTGTSLARTETDLASPRVAVTGGASYSVGFLEQGLPNGTRWSITGWGQGSPQLLSFSVASSPLTSTYDSHNHKIYVTELNGAAVAVVDPATDSVVKTIPVGDSPRRVVADPSTGLVYVSDTLSDQVTVINDSSNSVVQNVSVGPSPIGLAVDPARNRLVVDDSHDYDGTPGAGELRVYSLGNWSLLATLPVGNDSRQDYFDPASGLIYATNYGDGTAWLYDGSTFAPVTQVGVGSSPLGIMADPSASGILIVDNVNSVANGVLLGASNHSFARVCDLGSYPGIPVLDPANNWIYVPDEFTDSVLALNATTLRPVGNVSVGSYPTQAVYDPVSGNVLVIDGSSNQITVLPGSAATLPTGAVLDPETMSGVVAAGSGGLAFLVPNGTYHFSIAPTAGYVAIPNNWTVNVSGSGTVTSVRFYYTGQAPATSGGWLPSWLPNPFVLLGLVAVVAFAASVGGGLVVSRLTRPPAPPPPTWSAPVELPRPPQSQWPPGPR